MTNFQHKGDTVTVAAPGTVASGAGVKVGSIFGIASYDAVLNDSLELARKGVFDIAKDTSTFSQGDLVYWDDSAKKATSTATGNLLIGMAELAAATGVATVTTILLGPALSSQANGVKVAHAILVFGTDGGAQGAITPANSDTIPDNAVVFGGTLNATTAATSGGSATVAIGTAAGSAANSILTAAAVATLSADAVLKVTATATPFKMTAAGKITFTVATADLTAGVLEVWVLYAQASA
jgi:predicted RecA/RadA family phage recombinase